mgnify:CR=1 FL=1
MDGGLAILEPYRNSPMPEDSSILELFIPKSFFARLKIWKSHVFRLIIHLLMFDVFGASRMDKILELRILNNHIDMPTFVWET